MINEDTLPTKPCACSCGAEVIVDGIATALYVSHNGQKLFCATRNCRERLKKKLAAEQAAALVFTTTRKKASVCSPEGAASLPQADSRVLEQ